MRGRVSSEREKLLTVRGKRPYSRLSTRKKGLPSRSRDEPGNKREEYTAGPGRINCNHAGQCGEGGIRSTAHSSEGGTSY